MVRVGHRCWLLKERANKVKHRRHLLNSTHIGEEEAMERGGKVNAYPAVQDQPNRPPGAVRPDHTLAASLNIISPDN